MPPSTVQAPNRCSTYAVDPGPRRHVAQVVALGDERVPGHQPQPLVLERLLQPLEQRLPAVQPRGQVAGQVVGLPRVLEVAAAQHLPVVGVRRDVVDPPLPEPGAELVERRELRGPPVRHPHRRAVLEPVLAHHVERHQVQLALERPAGLAEEVAHHRRQQRVRRPRVPGEVVRAHLRQRRRPERPSARRRVTSWPSLASRTAAARPPNPPPTTTTRATVSSTSISGAPVIAASSSYVVENTAAGWPAAAQTTS